VQQPVTAKYEIGMVGCAPRTECGLAASDSKFKIQNSKFKIQNSKRSMIGLLMTLNLEFLILN
jgi:hypothetical protein